MTAARSSLPNLRRIHGQKLETTTSQVSFSRAIRTEKFARGLTRCANHKNMDVVHDGICRILQAVMDSAGNTATHDAKRLSRHGLQRLDLAFQLRTRLPQIDVGLVQFFGNALLRCQVSLHHSR